MATGAAVVGLAGVGTSMYAGVQGGKGARKAAKQQAQLSLLNGQLQAKAYQAQAGAFRAAAGAYGEQSKAYLQQSNLFMGQSEFTVAQGDLQKVASFRRATQAQAEGEINGRKVSDARMQLIGSAKTAFAKNGVLVVDRPDSAVSMWEQDEIADLGFELDQIQMNVLNEAGAHIHNGYMQKLQALYDAEGLSIQAMGAAINAQNAQISAANAIAQATQSEYAAQSAIIQGQSGASAANATANAATWQMIGALGSGFGSLASLGMSYASMQTPKVSSTG